MNDDQVISVGGQQFLRVPVTARLRRVEASAIPPELALASEQVSQQLHWNDKNNPDLVYVQFVLDTEGANANWDYMPRPQLIANHSTAIYKPFDMEHVIIEQNSMSGMSKTNPPVKNTIYGVMTSTALAWAKTGELLSKDEIKDLDNTDDTTRGDDDKVAVVAWGALYKFLFPQTVADVLEQIDNGQLAVSMERWIGKFDFLAWDGDKYQAVSREEGDNLGHYDRWKQHQTVNSKPIYRRSLSYVYGGVASTTNPANKLSRFIAPELQKAVASGDTTLLQLCRLHDALHTAFDVADGAEKAKIIAHHTQVTQAIGQLTGQVIATAAVPPPSRTVHPEVQKTLEDWGRKFADLLSSSQQAIQSALASRVATDEGFLEAIKGLA